VRDDATCPTRMRLQGVWTTCDQPVQGGTICPACYSDAAARIDKAAGVLTALRLIAVGLESLAESDSATGKAGSMAPVNVTALDAHATLKAALRDANVLNLRGDPQQRTTPDIHHRIAAADAAIAAAQRITDPAPPLVRIPCPTPGCARRIPIPRNHPHDAVITCHACGTWGVLSWWVDQVGVHHAPCRIVELPERLAAWGHPGIPTDTIRTWADRNHIPSSGRDDRGRRLYDPATVAAYAGQLAARSRKIGA
jgi:hypothetical protein